MSKFARHADDVGQELRKKALGQKDPERQETVQETGGRDGAGSSGNRAGVPA